MKKFLKKPIAIYILVGVILLGLFVFGRGAKKTTNQIVVVKKGEIIQQVSVTGRVKPINQADLGFEKAGRVADIEVRVGDKVFAGQILARLQNADLAAQLAQARAEVKVQQAKLDELQQGTRPEEIQIQEAEVAKAQAAVADAQKDVVNKIQAAYTQADDAVRNKADQFFNNPRIAGTQLSFPLDDFQLKTDTESQRRVVENILNAWKSDLANLTAKSDLDSEILTADKNLAQVVLFLNDAALAVNKAVANEPLTQTTIDTWKADLALGRTNLNTVIANLTAAQDELKIDQADLVLAQQNLILKKAGSTAAEIASQEAEVEAAQANVKNYQAQLAKTIIYAPFTGEVAKQGAKIGELVAAEDSLITIISKNKFELEAYIPEADISKVKIGDPATFTLDAYGEAVIFNAQVSEIETAETLTEGVATYKTTIQLTKEDERIKAGLTANLDILTAEKENVLLIPQRALISRNNEKYVLLDKGNNKTEEKQVQIGLKGSDGNVEILSGLNEGDYVVD